MRKALLLPILLLILILSGCSTIKDKVIEKQKTLPKEEVQQIVYCNDCGVESMKISKYCSNCGANAKWTPEKPTENNNEEVAKKDQVNTNQKSYKEEYLKKLDIIEENMSDLDYLYEEGITANMVEAEGTRLGRWDDMLNEIYSLLKTQLSENEMAELKRKQLNWIKYRDKTAENEAKEFEGGSMAGVQYNSSLARLTKERCYELVNIYMK